jgi:hypothetical protein
LTYTPSLERPIQPTTGKALYLSACSFCLVTAVRLGYYILQYVDDSLLPASASSRYVAGFSMAANLISGTLVIVMLMLAESRYHKALKKVGFIEKRLQGGCWARSLTSLLGQQTRFLKFWVVKGFISVDFFAQTISQLWSMELSGMTPELSTLVSTIISITLCLPLAMFIKYGYPLQATWLSQHPQADDVPLPSSLES